MFRLLLRLTGALITISSALSAQTTQFTYQGKLLDNGVAANGIYDIRFRLYPSAVSETQLGFDYVVQDVNVENGIFTTQISFGDAYFETSSVWLETAFRPGASLDAYTVQLPRQQIVSTPFALMSRKVRGDGIVGNLYLDSGTAGSPGLSFLNDTNSGLHSVSNNVIGISTNSSARVVIDAEGDVGIGIGGVPSSYRLTVKDSNHQIALQDTDSDKIWTLTTINNEGVGIYENGSTARLTVDAGGNVKVGSKSVVTSQNSTELQIVRLSGGFSVANMAAGASLDANIGWGNVGFTAPPSVAYAGITAGASGIGGISHFNIVPFDITTTGCKVRFTNVSSSAQNFPSLTVHFQVIGEK